MEWRKNLNYFILNLIVFSIPLSLKLTSILLLLIGVIWITESKIVTQLKVFVSNKQSILMILFYLTCVVSYFISDDKAKAGFDLEVKLSFILIPLIFGTSKVIKIEIEKGRDKLIQSFLLGLFFAVLINISIAAYKYFISGSLSYFTYSSFSSLLHSSYFALYLNTGLIFLLYTFKRKGNQRMNSYNILLLIMFSIAIVMSGSKAGIVSMLLIFIIYSGIQLIHNSGSKIGIATVCIVLLSVFFINQNDVLKTRANEMISALGEDSRNKDSSSNLRLAIWKVALERIIQEPVRGYGSGDVSAVLSKDYGNLNIKKAKDVSLNAHNQFLQTWLALGVIGLIVLMLMFINPMIFSFRRRNWSYFSILLLIGLNFLFESMLERQAGVIYFVLIHVMFYQENGEKIKGEQNKTIGLNKRIL